MGKEVVRRAFPTTYRVVDERVIEARRVASRRFHPGNIVAMLLLAFAAALCAVAGDRPGAAYNGWLVALAWALAILAWRAWADRYRGLRNPLVSLMQGALSIAGGFMGLAVSVAGMVLLIGFALLLLTLAEKLLR